MQYKYKLPIYQIDEDGDLKFIFFFNTDNVIIVVRIGGYIIIVISVYK